jgi:hypothetical protein
MVQLVQKNQTMNYSGNIAANLICVYVYKKPK